MVLPLQVKLCDRCLSALSVYHLGQKALYKYSSFPFLYRRNDGKKKVKVKASHTRHRALGPELIPVKQCRSLPENSTRLASADVAGDTARRGNSAQDRWSETAATQRV